MSLRYFSSCFTREFVAMGRIINNEEDAGEDFDDFLDDFVKLVRKGFDCGSMNRTVGVGPPLGTLLLNWECLECTGVRTSIAVNEMISRTEDKTQGISQKVKR
jgi:hypothetical protein